MSTPCETCVTKPCQSPYNEDGECWADFDTTQDPQAQFLLLSARYELEQLTKTPKRRPINFEAAFEWD